MPRGATGELLPRLLYPHEVARALGCSEWWVKEQARRRRIPFTKVGSAYRFTRDHLYEIIRIFEQRPDQRAATDTGAGPRRRGVSPQPQSPVVRLRARRPQRLPNAG
jgi:excisionase family DNA binding protein